jgi:hypothetical protein
MPIDILVGIFFQTLFYADEFFVVVCLGLFFCGGIGILTGHHTW